jgi:hypothetical protein
MRAWAALVVLVACGDNIHPAVDAPPGAADAGTDTGSDASASVCGDGTITGDEQCEDSATDPCCSGCRFVAFGVPCRDAVDGCDVAETCDGLSTACPADALAQNGTPCTGGFCQDGTCSPCNAQVDADFDGSNQCLDCDDSNGLVHPGAVETCNGLDDNCNGKIDETFDVDMDGFSVCSTDPLTRDCDDTKASVHPGAPELCGANGQGNNIDDNCNGFVDETCMPCDPTDNDGDGKSECQGDCDDADGNVGPGQAETCDGKDTDCNKFTVENCDVSDPCNFPGGADVCKDDLECGCVVGANGMCNGDFRCASFCEGSFTGAIGAGCTATQTCAFRWTLSDNQHACAETTAQLGTKLAGAPCGADAECRSGSCAAPCVGPGCNQKRCADLCDHHAPDQPGSCAAGTVCELVQAGAPTPAMFARCQLDDNGPRVTGESCAGGCVWGAASCVNNVCAQPCGDESQCPAGTHCSLLGNRVQAGTWGAGSPTGVLGQPAIETVPVCLADTGAGNHDRPGGAACTRNGDCTSQFCENTLHVCVDPCVTDASCAVGLTCEPVFLRPQAAATSGIVWGRACVNGSFGELLQSL